jgi:hypothetical protein
VSLKQRRFVERIRLKSFNHSGRNWSYLWNNDYIPKWAVVIMIAIFFVGLWILIMATLIREFSKTSSIACFSRD